MTLKEMYADRRNDLTARTEAETALRANPLSKPLRAALTEAEHAYAASGARLDYVLKRQAAHEAGRPLSD
jgi:hypothetical protein